MNYATKKCLAADNKGKVFTAKPNGKPSQKWRKYGNQLINEETNHILDLGFQGEVVTHQEGYGDNLTAWTTYWAT